MTIDILMEVVGYIGGALILAGYFLLSAGKVNAKSVSYQAMNVVGALGDPWRMLVDAVEQRSCRTNLDAVAALRAVQPSAVSTDNCIYAAVAGFDRILAHPLIADARAAFAENAALWIVSHHGRKIFFRLCVFLFGKPFFDITPIKNDLLKFAFTTAITDRTIQRVIGKQEFAHRPLCFFDLFALGGDAQHRLRRCLRARRRRPAEATSRNSL